MCEALRELVWERYGDEIEAAGEEAAKKATQRVNSLYRRLLELGRSEDVLKATTDSEYQEQLFKEFGL